jgi:hypothetical protein
LKKDLGLYSRTPVEQRGREQGGDREGRGRKGKRREREEGTEERK